MARAFLFGLIFLVTRASAAATDDFQVDAAFPGGNIQVLNRDGAAFVLGPDLRDTQGWWFHFHFRLKAPPEERAAFTFFEKSPIGVRGPAMSVDGGRTWAWMGKESVKMTESDGKPAWTFEGSVPKNALEVRFAFAPPYLESHLRDFLDKHRSNSALQVSELCRSRKGRRVDMIRAGCLDSAKAKGVVLLTARHHACESMASYAMEGFLDAALASDEIGRRWQANWEIIALPFADKDGVEDGDQGKNRKPHDHNRDYNATPLYPEVAAWMKVGNANKDRVRISLDLHCPHISGQWNDRVYIVGSSAPAFAAKEKAFALTLEKTRRGPIPFRAADCYLAAGTAWNQPSNYSAGRSSSAWARATFPDSLLAATIEIAYADAQGAEVNAETARALGNDLARAVLAQLEDK